MMKKLCNQETIFWIAQFMKMRCLCEWIPKWEMLPKLNIPSIKNFWQIFWKNWTMSFLQTIIIWWSWSRFHMIRWFQESKTRSRIWTNRKDPSLIDYYGRLLKYYEEFEENYNQSEMLVIDGDKFNFVENIDDRNHILDMIEMKLVDLGNIDCNEYETLRQKRLGWLFNY